MLGTTANPHDRLEPVVKPVWGNLSSSCEISDCVNFARKCIGTYGLYLTLKKKNIYA